jgi:hypothetical protein
MIELMSVLYFEMLLGRLELFMLFLELFLLLFELGYGLGFELELGFLVLDGGLELLDFLLDLLVFLTYAVLGFV